MDTATIATIIGTTLGAALIAYELGKQSAYAKGKEDGIYETRVNIGNEIAIRGSFYLSGTRYKALEMHRT